MQYELRKASTAGWFRSFVSGEGIVADFAGPGEILIQTRNLAAFAGVIKPFFPTREAAAGPSAIFLANNNASDPKIRSQFRSISGELQTIGGRLGINQRVVRSIISSRDRNDDPGVVSQAPRVKAIVTNHLKSDIFLSHIFLSFGLIF